MDHGIALDDGDRNGVGNGTGSGAEGRFVNENFIYNNRNISNSMRSNGHTIIPLELEDEEEEEQELLRETAGQESPSWARNKLSYRLTSLRGKKNHSLNLSSHSDRNGRGSTSTASTIAHLLRSDLTAGWSQFSCRNICLLSVLAGCVVLLLRALDWDVLYYTPSQGESINKPPHGASHGGLSNPAYYKPGSNDNGVNKNYDELLPKSNTGYGIDSINPENYDNSIAHYVHDPFLSPFASPLYKDSTNVTRKAIQDAFAARMGLIKREYGQWERPDHEVEMDGAVTALQIPDAYLYRYSDMPIQEMMDNAWQLNAEYVTDFTQKGIELIQRVRQGILVEYGLDKLDAAQRQQVVAVHHDENQYVIKNGAAYDKLDPERKLLGVAYMKDSAWEALILKLLHAMMTNDYFFAVVVGPSSTYRANNFMQSQIMQFNLIMEPTFDKLGIKLLSRNMGMNASTTISALGGASVYGEADLLWYVPDPRPDAIAETEEQFDLLQKQMILSGERMPIILTPMAGRLSTDTNGLAWEGNIQPGSDGVCDTTTANSLPALPVCQYVTCSTDAMQAGICNHYNSACWVNRVDFTPNTSQDATVGWQTEGYPSLNHHRWDSRKLVLVVLQALEEALTRWKDQCTLGTYPLPEKMWHVGSKYEQLRESVRTMERKAGTSVDVPPCEKLLKNLDPMICHLSMRAFTEWTPQVNPEESTIRSIINADITIVDPRTKLTELYNQLDLLPPQWKIPDDQIDVHMIAVATDEIDDNGWDSSLFVPGDGDDWWNYGDDDAYDDSDFDDDGAFGDDDVNSVYDDYFQGGDDDGSNGGGGRRRWRRKLSSQRRGSSQRRRVQKQQQQQYRVQKRRQWQQQQQQQQKFQVQRQLQQQPNRRNVADSAPPKAWVVLGSPIGFCDGSAQSQCNRRIGNKCLLSNYNFYRGGLSGGSDSGWLNMTIPLVDEGIVLARFEWSGINNHRQLAELPDDFIFEYVVNGQVKKLSKAQFMGQQYQIASDLFVFPLLMDRDMSLQEGEKKEIDVSIQIRSTDATASKVLLTHIYYA